MGNNIMDKKEKLSSGKGMKALTYAKEKLNFVFEKINVPLPEGYSIMDGKYFDLTSYSGYIKINLLSPSIHLLYNAPF